MSALGKALEGGSAWQVRGNVHLDVGVRAFHVAGVGKGGHRRCRERGFAWPAWGSVHAACVSRGRRGEWCDRWPCWASFCVAGAGNPAAAETATELSMWSLVAEFWRFFGREVRGSILGPVLGSVLGPKNVPKRAQSGACNVHFGFFVSGALVGVSSRRSPNVKRKQTRANCTRQGETKRAQMKRRPK